MRQTFEGNADKAFGVLLDEICVGIVSCVLWVESNLLAVDALDLFSPPAYRPRDTGVKGSLEFQDGYGQVWSRHCL